MGGAAVVGEVGDVVPERHEHVEVGEGAEHGSPYQGLAARLPPQDAVPDRGPEGRLGQRIHGDSPVLRRDVRGAAVADALPACPVAAVEPVGMRVQL